MIKSLSPYLFALMVLFSACDQEKETPILNLEQDYQPLGIGLFWIYAVEETIYFGENDSEFSEFFYRDRVRSSYLNAENEVTYIVERAKSPDGLNWNLELEYTMIFRDRSLLRTVQNSTLVPLVFAPDLGRVWNGKAYQAEGEDEFEIDLVESITLTSNEQVTAVRVNQEDLDDQITIRDIRFETFGKGVGLIEKYDEVLTYCSRNDCLGQQLISSGIKIHLKLVEYGSN
ncbi:hypothetical protein [Algoriphagus litoralis]|uniref:hypothetical protein n=1 Tax=Algoriphagus litoralis TaxID=2202829 RepID=UPI0013009B43|nr:hypothetical protein [Algoriphagus litoralis]